MEKNIYIVRHCEAEGQPQEAQLTENGFNQAMDLADFLKQFKIRRIISSPFLRAIQSIEPFAKNANLEVEIESRLAERVLSSQNLPDWMEKLCTTFIDLDVKYEGGESSREAMRRIVSIIDETTSNAVIVTHGNLMSLLLHNYNKDFGFEQWKDLSNPDVYLLRISENDCQIERLWTNS